MYLPNTTLKIRSTLGFDEYGQERIGSLVTEPCAIVYARYKSDKTTVRTDSSASRGHGREKVSDARILVGPKTVSKLDDKIEVASLSFRIVDKQPRFDVNGNLDHYQLEAESWA